METKEFAWSTSAIDLIEDLKSTHTGLTEKEAKTRLAKYGNNTFHSKEKVSIFSLFLKQFVSPLIFLLMAASILTIILKEWIDTIGIIFVILVNVSLGLYHEYGAENTLEKLTTYIKDRSRVLRDGVEEEIDSALLVPGDIIKLSYGTRIPADARLITTNNFLVDEAILTGESMPVVKKEDVIKSINTETADRKNIAHAGTLVVQGYASAVVYATGNNTEIGKIAGIVSKIKRADTPLQKGVSHLAWSIFLLVIIIVVLIFVLGISRGEPILPMLVLSSAVAVGAVPESLPITLTMILAIGALRIANKKGIIKKLAGAETLGSTTLIMTDKTGTLTTANMQLDGIYGKDALLSGVIGPNLKIGENKTLSLFQIDLLKNAISNIDIIIENPKEDKKDWIFRGRPFEINIAKAARFYDISFDLFSSKDSRIILPFNSTNKFSIAENDGVYFFMGAPDVLIKKSKISEEDRLKMEYWVDATSREGKRLVGIASFQKTDKNDLEHFELKDLNELEFLGILSFYDEIRPEVPHAIKNIESHGVKMIIITGDLVGTALSLAKSLDWEVKSDEVMTGSEIREYSDQELLMRISKIKIFARVTPEDKLRIGQLYQKLGEVVAMTGDGVNDAPALKAMDIGISLGTASDVAKAAADIVLLDDNFETISLAIDEGRRILANIRKSFVYLLATSLDDVFVIGGSLLFGLALPLTALQIIWVNLFTGSLPSLAFAYDENLDKRKSFRNSSKVIFTNEMKALTLSVGIISSILLFLLYFSLLKIGIPLSLARSIFFVCFSSYVLAIAFSFRSLNRPLFSYATFTNKKLNMSILISLFFLILTMVVPFFRNIFELAPLPIIFIPFVVLWLIINIILVEGIKYIFSSTAHIFFKKDKVRFYFVNK